MTLRRICSRLASLAAMLSLLSGGVPAEARTGSDRLHRPLDELLDLLVRDGLVYYRALQIERGQLDRYIASLDVAPAVFERWSRDEQVAFWLNAYNAFVLQTVVDRYPIRGRSPDYPANSIRQIPGAFDRLPHRAAGRTVTLDEIEKTILPAFRDPRLHLALGRGAVGGGRLRSEAYEAGRLESQLSAVAAECVTRKECLSIDAISRVVSISAIFGWYEQEFVAAFGGSASPRFASRSPVERAILAFVGPQLLPQEREFVEQNDFRVEYREFDWRLNDLTGGRRD